MTHIEFIDSDKRKITRPLPTCSQGISDNHWVGHIKENGKSTSKVLHPNYIKDTFFMDNVTKVVLFKTKTKETCENRPNIKQKTTKNGKKRIKKYAESFQRDPSSLITKVMKSEIDETWMG